MAPKRGLGRYLLRPRKISDSRKTGGRKPKIQRVSVPHAASDKILRLKKELLPGIDNQVTLEDIASRVPWMTLQTLSSVNPAWHQAIGDRLTYEARVRTNSRETFVVVNNITRGPEVDNGIALLSVRDKVWYQLPPIPHVGIPWGCQCATLDGKVYIFGGLKNPDGIRGRKDVYVLDLAGRKHWQKCAKMQEERCDFGCVVNDGEIYVFGGCRNSDSHILCRAEVYDPQENAWSAIKPMPSSNWNHLHNMKVGTVGEELRVYCGKGTCSELWAYNPVMDDWRTIVTNFGNTANRGFFMEEGKLCSVYVPERLGGVRQVLAVDGEYFAIVDDANGIQRMITRSRGRGLCISNTEAEFALSLEKVIDMSFGLGKVFMCPIQL